MTSLASFRHPFSVCLAIYCWMCGSMVFGQNNDSLVATSNNYFQATLFYEARDYPNALVYFDKVMSESPTFAKRYPEVLFKAAYCNYKTGRYEAAAEMFAREGPALELVRDYANFLIIQVNFHKQDTLATINALKQFNARFSSSTLRQKSDSLLAELLFHRKAWREAAPLYRRMLKYPDFDKGEIYGRLIHIDRHLGDVKGLKSYAYTLLQKYPYHPRSKEAYRELRRIYADRLFPQSKHYQVFRYLARTQQFEEAGAFLDRQVSIGGRSEQIRWLRIRQKYYEKKYWATLQDCLDQRDLFPSLRYRREVDLHIARCQLRLGFTDKAIQGYATFQERYPTDRLAPEVLWVIAWLCEEEGRHDEAMAYYRRIITRYPRYEFVSESRFRIGLNHFRRGNYPQARESWEYSLNRERRSSWKARYSYWIARSFLAQDSVSAYQSILEEISADPFDNYYSLKAFLLTRSDEDTEQFVDSLVSEMNHQQVSFLPKYLKEFQKPLLVQELLGDYHAQRELNALAKQIKATSWEMVFALGEVNDRMRNYGRAYRLYRRVFSQEFSKKNWSEYVFLLKHLYPFYFDGEVEAYARKWNITPASIWAVMKKESAFEPQIMSYANAYGLMQIIPPTANRLSESLGVELDDVRQLYKPQFNIQLGSYYLFQLLKRYDGNLYHALAAYNAGEHRVDRWRKTLQTEDDDFFMENVEFEQTRGYVRGVMKFYWTYHLLVHPYEISQDMPSFPERAARSPWFENNRKY